MALGNSRPRNWGKDSQEIALALLLKRNNLAYQLTPMPALDQKPRMALKLAGRKGEVTTPFAETCAELVNVRRGVWKALHVVDGRTLAAGISLRDAVRRTIEVVLH